MYVLPASLSISEKWIERDYAFYSLSYENLVEFTLTFGRGVEFKG